MIYPLQINESYLHAKFEPTRMKNDKVMAKILGTSKFGKSHYIRVKQCLNYHHPLHISPITPLFYKWGTISDHKTKPKVLAFQNVIIQVSVISGGHKLAVLLKCKCTLLFQNRGEILKKDTLWSTLEAKKYLSASERLIKKFAKPFRQFRLFVGTNQQNMSQQNSCKSAPKLQIQKIKAFRFIQI